MKSLLPLLISVAASSWTFAGEVRWSAEGTVSGVEGSGFPEGVVAGAPVEIELSYRSDAEVRALSFLAYPAGSQNGQARFFGEVDLNLSVKVGDEEWSGQLERVPDSVAALVTDCWDFVAVEDAPLVESMDVEVAEEVGASFSSFPFEGDEASRTMSLALRDSLSPNDLFRIHVLPDSLSAVTAVMSADGEVTAGAASFSFALDPETVSVREDQVPVAIAGQAGDLELTWASESGKSYRVDQSENLRDWTFFRSVSGTPEEAFLTFSPDDSSVSSRFFRVVVFDD